MHKLAVKMAGLFGAAALFAVMALIFVAVLLRYLFGYVVPDSYDLSRMFLGILIFWGIALAVAENAMIRVDALHAALGPAGRRIVGVFSAAVTCAVLAALAWRAGHAVADAHASHIATNDMRLRLWPFYAVASIALAVAVWLAVLNLRAALLGQDDGRP